MGAVKLESAHPAGRTRYLVVVSRTGSLGAEEACLLGIDCNSRTTIGSRHTRLGRRPHHARRRRRFQRNIQQRALHFQAGFCAGHVVCAAWVQYYAERIQSDQSCLNEWHAMDDLVSKRPPTPDFDRSRPTQKEETEVLIRSKLKELMMSVDLDEVTSKFMRSRLEEELDMSLQQFKPFIDQEMLTILGQMDAATEILEYLYLGSEWNASNLEELKDKGVGHILNVTREIDNFYPGLFDYFNIRVYDDETTEMLKHWDKTYKYIAQAKEQGSKVLVHCKMGISRSASVVIAYVMKAYGWDLRQALDFVKTRRSCIKPNSGFLKQLETYQGILHASKQRHNSIWRSKSETNLKDEQPDRGGGGGGSNSLLVPGSVSRPKSWSPDDLASDAFFAANSSNNNSDTISNTCHAIATGRMKPRRRIGRPRYGTDPLCYAIPHTSTTSTLEQVQATEQEKNAKNAAANGMKASLPAVAPVTPSKCSPAVVAITDDEQDPGLRRVASVKDRICELESQQWHGQANHNRHSLEDLLNLGTTDESSVNLYSCLPSCGGGESSSLELLRDVQPVASQTKPLTPKHMAVIVKSSPAPSTWTLGGGAGDCDKEPELAVTTTAPPPMAKEATFSSVLRRSAEDRVPTSQEIFKLQVGFGEDRSQGTTLEARRDATSAVAPQLPLVAELQVDGKKTELLEERAGAPPDRAGVLPTRCKLRKTKPFLEEKSFARALCLEGGAFPSQTRSTPSTPPEQLPDASSPSRQILRSQSLRCEHRPKSLALPAASACMSGRSPPKILMSRSSEAQPLPAFSASPEIKHSMSTPSVMEAVNEVLCETRQVISNAMHLIPCAKTPPETYSPLLCSGQGLEHIESDSNPASESSEVPQVGIVRQQRAVLEGLQPPRGNAAALPTAVSTDRKPPTGDSTGRSKKEQARIIKELGSTMLPSVPGDSPPFCGSNTTTDQQQPDDDESAVGVVKRLTKELEAKARNGKTKPAGIAERLVIVERSSGDSNEPTGAAARAHQILQSVSATVTVSLCAVFVPSPKAGPPVWTHSLQFRHRPRQADVPVSMPIGFGSYRPLAA
ncbi:hypothetical protein MTO96_030422 [Rhipicephalus appendiculatus]